METKITRKSWQQNTRYPMARFCEVKLFWQYSHIFCKFLGFNCAVKVISNFRAKKNHFLPLFRLEFNFLIYFETFNFIARV